MAQIIGIVQVKGGAGRSTVATNMAATLAQKAATALIDCDMPQGTAMSWYALRSAENRTNGLKLATARDHKELIAQVQGLTPLVEYIVLDAPPRIAEITRAILMLTDLVVIPLGPSAPEIWATTDLLETISEAKEKRPQLDYRILWTRYRGYTRSARELSTEVHQEIAAPEFKARLGFRVAYADALACGRSAAEWHDKPAKEETQALSRELIELLGKK
ncbi:MAG: ParA family protein [Gammaproteobacteria bacterium]|nr:ParA family protein [Gammaproteobacteria bacterium]